MKKHLTEDAFWMRCRAVKRVGHGVTGCPIGSTTHVDGRAGIAEGGGGRERRFENGGYVYTTISAKDEDGCFTATSDQGKVRWYNSDGQHVSKRERMYPKNTEPIDEPTKVVS